MGNLEDKIKLTVFRDMPEEGFFSMERYADELVRHLPPAELAITEFTIHKTKFIRPLRVVLKLLPFFKNYGQDLFFSRLLLYPWLAKKRQGEVNHIVDHSYAHLLYHLDPRRTVVTCHDLIPLEYEKDPAALRVFSYSVGGLKKAAAIIVPSQATKRDLIGRLGLGEEKVKVVYSGVDRRKFKVRKSKLEVEKMREKHRLPRGRILLHTGSSLVYKNVEGVLRALRIALGNGSDVSLVKVGELTRRQRRLAGELGVAGRIIERKNLSDDDLSLLYNLAAVLVYPSLKEGFGFPTLEALSCGCPVVVSKGTSLEEIAGEAAFLVDSGDPESIAAGIREALDSEASSCRAKVELGLKRARFFSWEKCARKTAEIYGEVLRTPLL